MGNTGFSTGPHLHFGVYNLSESNADSFNYFNNTVAPFDFLSSRGVSFQAQSCDDVSSNINKTVGSGGVAWPMNGDIIITQCYGHTPWSWMYGAINFHQGVDMYATGDISVHAVDEGEAYFYRGSSSFGNNVRIFS